MSDQGTTTAPAELGAFSDRQNVDPTPSDDQTAALPTVDDIVPAWTRDPDRKVKLNAAEKAARDEVNRRRALVADMLGLLRTTLDQVATRDATITELTQVESGLRGDLQSERLKSGDFDSFRLTAMIFITVSGQLAAATGIHPSETKLVGAYECHWTFGDTKVVCTRYEVRIAANSVDGITLKITTSGLSARQIAMIKPYFTTPPPSANVLSARSKAVASMVAGVLAMERMAGRRDLGADYTFQAIDLGQFGR
ncbi:MAG TPA: hypothetical protein VLG92_02585 [Candidatus Saccharimonadia bacterium]|nr:hypothetical protein [Candidatus Saccharimonadia bacterium]